MPRTQSASFHNQRSPQSKSNSNAKDTAFIALQQHFTTTPNMIHCDWNNITSTRFTICHVSHCEKYCPYAIFDSNNTNHNMPILSCITKTLYSIIQNKQPIKSIPTFIITRNKNNNKIVMLSVHSYTIWSSLMFKINHNFQIPQIHKQTKTKGKINPIKIFDYAKKK